jgi:hypothetical protein
MSGSSLLSNLNNMLENEQANQNILPKVKKTIKTESKKEVMITSKQVNLQDQKQVQENKQDTENMITSSIEDLSASIPVVQDTSKPVSKQSSMFLVNPITEFVPLKVFSVRLPMDLLKRVEAMIYFESQKQPQKVTQQDVVTLALTKIVDEAGY